MRMKWKNILAVIAIPVAIAAGVYAYEPPAELIEYRTEAEQGGEEHVVHGRNNRPWLACA